MPGPDVEKPRAQRAQQALVARRRQQVDAVGLHVDGQMPGRLGGIDEERDIVLAGELADRADGCTVPVTLEAWVTAMSLVSGRIAWRMSSGSTRPVIGSTRTLVSVDPPGSASALSGRRMELWSMAVQMA